MEPIEVISDTHLKVILENLTAKDIVEYAYKEWIPSQRTGHTILNLETGMITGIGVELNDITILNMAHIKLFTIDSFSEIITPEELFSQEEYDLYLDFKENEPSEYTPDIVTEFCEKNNIDEKKRIISILANKFELEEMFNYNMWETRVLNEYYNLIL